MSHDAGDQGVYYRQEDHAGFWCRLTIDLVDVAASAVLWLVLFLAIAMLLPLDEEQFETEEMPASVTLVMWLAAAVVGFSYFVVLKRLFRTLGHTLCRTRIVDLQGERPGIFALTIRFLFALFGPLNFFLDLLWIPSDRYRQALRDKFAHTLVIHADAVPAGRGNLVYRTYYVMGAAFLFAEVLPPDK